MTISIKDKILKFFGFSLLFIGILLFVIGIGMYAEKDSFYSGQGPSIAIASTGFLVPGAILILLGVKSRRERELIESIASIVKSYRRITLADLALKLGQTIPQTGKLLSGALTKKLIRGNFDRTTDEFFTEEAVSQSAAYKFCPGCGAPLDRTYMLGETLKCGTCGMQHQIQK